MDFFSAEPTKGESSGSSDYDEDSSDESVDSATLRAIEADSKLKDYGTRTAPTKTGAIVSADAVFTEVDGPPAFLDPEATRPLATCSNHGRGAVAAAPASNAPKTWHGPRGRVPPGQDFDIARLVPPMKGEQRKNKNERDVPAAALIEGKAKRYKVEEGPEATQQYTPAQIAMMGGNVADKAGPTPAMAVEDFLAKGGGVKLPRQQEERKDKEKSKRMRGQSTHAVWKSEAEMVLRQQFDS